MVKVSRFSSVNMILTVIQFMWHFRNDERPFAYWSFRPKSTFIPRKKDNLREAYHSPEERLLDIDVSSKIFNNLSKEECNALYS